MTDDGVFLRKTFQFTDNYVQDFTMQSILPLRLLGMEQERQHKFRFLYQYQRANLQSHHNIQRVSCLDQCLKNKVVPEFLLFRNAKNVCFDQETVKNFQRKLLTKEVARARAERAKLESKLTESRVAFIENLAGCLVPFVIKV